MKVLFCSLLGLTSFFVSCAPQGPLSENFRRISERESQVQIIRSEASRHDHLVASYRERGWRVVGESDFAFEKRLSSREVKAFAARKRANQVVISESWQSPTKELQVTTLGPAREETPDLPHKENYTQRAEIRAGKVHQVTKTRRPSWRYRVTFLRSYASAKEENH